MSRVPPPPVDDDPDGLRPGPPPGLTDLVEDLRGRIQLRQLLAVALGLAVAGLYAACLGPTGALAQDPTPTPAGVPDSDTSVLVVTTPAADPTAAPTAVVETTPEPVATPDATPTPTAMPLAM